MDVQPGRADILSFLPPLLGFFLFTQWERVMSAAIDFSCGFGEMELFLTPVVILLPGPVAVETCHIGDGLG